MSDVLPQALLDENAEECAFPFREGVGSPRFVTVDDVIAEAEEAGYEDVADGVGGLGDLLLVRKECIQ